MTRKIIFYKFSLVTEYTRCFRNAVGDCLEFGWMDITS